MGWDFETDPDFRQELEWIDQFVTAEVERLDRLIVDPYDVAAELRHRHIPPLQERVKARGLWACHLGPELGGPGYGQVKLALINEILGRSRCAPIVFGCQAPDSGNSEILAHFGTPEQKQQWLEPLLAGEMPHPPRHAHDWTSCLSASLSPWAWRIDRYNDYRRVRGDISAIKAMMPRVLHDIAARALQIHGSLGVSQEMPFLDYISDAFYMGLADGPTEVHLLTLARQILKNHEPAPGLFPTRHQAAVGAATGGEYD
jgi:alkylation response protein AidB-like acyl-CoA dehydrogenase